MPTRRSVLLTIGASVLGAPIIARAQAVSGKVRKIGFLGTGTAAGSAQQVDALRGGLKDLGYVEGKNTLIEYRWADGALERLPQLAAELLREKVDIIVTYGTAGVRAAQRATTTVPIIIASLGVDPVAQGFAKSLARPGGNITGTLSFGVLLISKQVELIKDTLPQAHRIAFMTPVDATARMVKNAEDAAKALKLDFQLVPNVKSENQFESAITGMAERRVDALVVASVPVYTAHENRIAAIATRQRIPTFGRVSLAESGALIGYGVNQLNNYRRTAYFIDRIFNGANAGDLPMEQPMTFELVVNLKTAAALGVKIPDTVLVRADRVIK